MRVDGIPGEQRALDEFSEPPNPNNKTKLLVSPDASPERVEFCASVNLSCCCRLHPAHPYRCAKTRTVGFTSNKTLLPRKLYIAFKEPVQTCASVSAAVIPSTCVPDCCRRLIIRCWFTCVDSKIWSHVRLPRKQGKILRACYRCADVCPSK